MDRWNPWYGDEEGAVPAIPSNLVGFQNRSSRCRECKMEFALTWVTYSEHAIRKPTYFPISSAKITTNHHLLCLTSIWPSPGFLYMARREYNSILRHSEGRQTTSHANQKCWPTFLSFLLLPILFLLEQLATLICSLKAPAWNSIRGVMTLVAKSVGEIDPRPPPKYIG